MKVATWNLERPLPSNGRRVARIVEEIGRVGADIWVLTETHDVVSPGTSYSCVSTTGMDHPGEPGERWVTIWSHYGIEPLNETSDPMRAVAARVVPPVGPPLIVYGTVLPWLGSPWRHVVASRGQAFAAALEAQASDWRRLRALYSDHDFLLAGDFNQDLANTHYYGSRSNRRALQDALNGASLVALSAGDNDPVRRDSPPCACIDHICLSDASLWKPGELCRWPAAATPNPGLSDHFGIEVTFELAIALASPENGESTRCHPRRTLSMK